MDKQFSHQLQNKPESLDLCDLPSSFDHCLKTPIVRQSTIFLNEDEEKRQSIQTEIQLNFRTRLFTYFSICFYFRFETGFDSKRFTNYSVDFQCTNIASFNLPDFYESLQEIKYIELCRIESATMSSFIVDLFPCLNNQ